MTIISNFFSSVKLTTLLPSLKGWFCIEFEFEEWGLPVVQPDNHYWLIDPLCTTFTIESFEKLLHIIETKYQTVKSGLDPAVVAWFVKALVHIQMNKCPANGGSNPA